MTPRTCGSSLAGATFAGTQLRPFDVHAFVTRHREFFASAEPGLSVVEHATSVQFNVSLLLSRFDPEGRASAAFTFEATGLERFACVGNESFSARANCGSDDLRSIVLNVGSCPRFRRDPGFATDLRGARSFTLPYVDEGFQLQTICPNLPILRRVPTALVSCAMNGSSCDPLRPAPLPPRSPPPQSPHALPTFRLRGNNISDLTAALTATRSSNATKSAPAGGISATAANAATVSSCRTPAHPHTNPQLCRQSAPAPSHPYAHPHPQVVLALTVWLVIRSVTRRLAAGQSVHDTCMCMCMSRYNSSTQSTTQTACPSDTSACHPPFDVTDSSSDAIEGAAGSGTRKAARARLRREQGAAHHLRLILRSRRCGCLTC